MTSLVLVGLGDEVATGCGVVLEKVMVLLFAEVETELPSPSVADTRERVMVVFLPTAFSLMLKVKVMTVTLLMMGPRTFDICIAELPGDC